MVSFHPPLLKKYFLLMALILFRRSHMIGLGGSGCDMKHKSPILPVVPPPARRLVLQRGVAQCLYFLHLKSAL